MPLPITFRKLDAFLTAPEIFLCLLVFLFVSVQETMNHTRAKTLS